MKNVVALALLVSLATACGGTVVFEDEGVGDDGGGGDGGGGAGGPTGGPSGPTGSITVTVGPDATQGAGGFGTGGYGTGGFGTGGFGTGGFGGEVDVIEVFAALTANCKPVIGPDPMNGIVAVEYENPSSEVGSLEIVRADVIFSNRFEGWVFPIELAPTSTGDIEPGTTVSIDHQKQATAGDSSFVCQLCYVPGSVTLRFRRPDGTEFDASGGLTLECGF